jgi:ATP-dependent protease ClpP protease subunit
MLSGPINRKNIAKALKSLTDTQTHPKRLIITNSLGGDLDAIRPLVDAILRYRAITIARGMVASSAAAVFLAGEHRFMEPSAVLVIHEPRFTFPSEQTISDMEAHLFNARRSRTFYREFLPNSSFKLTEKEIYSHEAIHLGLATGILTHESFAESEKL